MLQDISSKLKGSMFVKTLEQHRNKSDNKVDCAQATICDFTLSSMVFSAAL